MERETSGEVGQKEEQPAPLPSKVHCIGVCGTGMGALALLFREKGVAVSGSDLQAYPPMGDLLRGAGIDVRLGYRCENVDADVQYVVVGNAVSRNNEEVEETIRRGIPYGSFPESLSRFFLAGREPVVVVGTHGKTTSTAMLAWILEAAGHDPGFLVGGEPMNFCSSSRCGTGRFFVVEGDEYDSAFFDKGPKFLHYRPVHALFTSLEYDHADIYPDEESLKIQFLRFVEKIPARGLVLVCAEYPGAVEIACRGVCRVETYGFDPGADWYGRVVERGSEGFSLEVCCKGEPFGVFRCPLSGSHNGLNALGSLALLSRLGVDAELLRNGLAGFAGVRRRQELLGEAGGVVLVDDFAHHPTAVRETLRALGHRFPGRRVVAVYEPRTQTSRRRVFQRQYVEAFDGADLVLCSRLFRAETVPEKDRFKPELWEQDMRRAGRKALYVPDLDSLENFLVENAKPGDLLVFMSSGDFEGLPTRVLRRLGSAGKEGPGTALSPAV